MATTPAPSSPAPRICPECGAGLQRLEGRDGYQVDSRFDRERRNGALIEVQVVGVIHACQRCEYVGTGSEFVV